MNIDKLEEDMSISMTNSTAYTKPPVTLRLVVPASQCGFLIKKGGCKIKEMRENTGAQVQVARNILPNSTERTITIAGIPQSIIENVKLIVWSHWSPPKKGMTIPYWSKPYSSLVIFAGGQDRYSRGSHSANFSHTTLSIYLNPDLKGPLLVTHTIPQPGLSKFHQWAMQQSHCPMTHCNTEFSGIESSCPEMKGYWGLDASAQLLLRNSPNDLIGCTVGSQGSKINEIRQMTGMQIIFTNLVEASNDGQVTISGSATSISLAQYLINIRRSLEVTWGAARTEQMYP